MTAVASPIPLQPPPRKQWNTFSSGQGSSGNMNPEDMSRMFVPGPRKSAQRTKSSSSLQSNSSVSSAATIAAPSASNNANTSTSGDTWASKKKTSRGLWPPGKSEPTAGISTARPQSVSTATSGPSAASAISALHTPTLPSQQNAGQAQQNGVARNTQNDAPALLYLVPMNGTFERKTIHVPFYPELLRIGRQTNAKTAPTPTNGFFDSKVLSRQHAEVYAERNGRVFIRDIKSSNGTFVNGKRLSPENKESEPLELREQDVLELGIDIVSEDQKTVVHHKVAARVEHAGIYSQPADMNFGDLDPSGAGGYGSAPHLKRNGSAQSVQGAKANALAAAAMAARDGNGMQQQAWSRMWLQPISTEQIVKRLNRELGLARQQSQDLQRTQQCIDVMFDSERNGGENDENHNPNPPQSNSIKIKTDKTSFTEPPAPPPRQPLPEKPDVAKALSDPVILPLLQRADTARPGAMFGNISPTRADHSQTLLILTQELKSAKDQIPSLEGRVKDLEQKLMQEKSARELAERRAAELEHATRKDSASDNNDAHEMGVERNLGNQGQAPHLQNQLDSLRAAMEDSKQQMQAYRKRAETAESERDESRQTLAEMIDEKRRRNTETNGQQSKEAELEPNDTTRGLTPHANGHPVTPSTGTTLPMESLLRRAGVDASKPMTKEQAATLHRMLGQETLQKNNTSSLLQTSTQFSYLGVPPACALTTVVIGLALMHYLNGWEKIQSVLGQRFVKAEATWRAVRALSYTYSESAWMVVISLTRTASEQAKETLLRWAEAVWEQGDVP